MAFPSFVFYMKHESVFTWGNGAYPQAQVLQPSPAPACVSLSASPVWPTRMDWGSLCTQRAAGADKTVTW